ncbi:hypothetical protein [Spongiactinospora sp. 9N601]|uniref:hypothetical protein n=1 Tax=Spongiactinospora sp. 9N601 TaxID=3375149 RepID=UPI0037A8C4DA
MLGILDTYAYRSAERQRDPRDPRVLSVKTLLNSGVVAPSVHYDDNPERHPSWEVYSRLMRYARVPIETTTESWKLLLAGLREQEAINRQYGQMRSKPASHKYCEFADILSNLLLVRKDRRLALWSGGADISEYAARKGFEVLESTALGSILNQLRIHQEWKLQSPLWYVISRRFLELYSGQVHIFLAAYEAPYDNSSCLMRHEVPILLDLAKSGRMPKRMEWHPVYYAMEDGEQVIKEITADLQLVKDSTFHSVDDCMSVLIRYLALKHRPGNDNAERAFREALLRFQNYDEKYDEWSVSRFPSSRRDRRALLAALNPVAPLSGFSRRESIIHTALSGTP